MSDSTKPDYSSVPRELTNSSQWLVTKFVADPTPANPDHKRKPPLSVKTSKLMDVFKNPDASLFVPFDQARSAEDFDALGYCITNTPYICADVDHGFDGDTEKPWVRKFLEALPGRIKHTYAESSISADGAHVWFRVANIKDKPAGEHKDIASFPDGKIELFYRGYLTITGKVIEGASSEIAEITIQELRAALDAARPTQSAVLDVRQNYKSNDKKLELLLAGKIIEAGFTDPTGDSDADFFACKELTKKFNGNRTLIKQVWTTSALGPLLQRKPNPSDYVERTLDAALKDFEPNGKEEIDPETWREGFMSFDELPQDPPRGFSGNYAAGVLIPENAFGAVVASSYQFKSWLSLAMAKAVSEGESLWGFDAPATPVPVNYHVPEMNASSCAALHEDNWSQEL